MSLNIPDFETKVPLPIHRAMMMQYWERCAVQERISKKDLQLVLPLFFLPFSKTVDISLEERLHRMYAYNRCLTMSFAKSFPADTYVEILHRSIGAETSNAFMFLLLFRLGEILDQDPTRNALHFFPDKHSTPANRIQQLWITHEIQNEISVDDFPFIAFSFLVDTSDSNDAHQMIDAVAKATKILDKTAEKSLTRAQFEAVLPLLRPEDWGSGSKRKKKSKKKGGARRKAAAGSDSDVMSSDEEMEEIGMNKKQAKRIMKVLDLSPSQVGDLEDKEVDEDTAEPQGAEYLAIDDIMTRIPSYTAASIGDEPVEQKREPLPWDEEFAAGQEERSSDADGVSSGVSYRDDDNDSHEPEPEEEGEPVAAETSSDDLSFEEERWRPTMGQRCRKWCWWNKWKFVIAFIIIAILVVILVPSSFHRLEATQIGIAYDTASCKLGNETLWEGRYTLGPSGKILKFSATQITENDRSNNVFSRDGIILDVLYQLAFTITPKDLREVVDEWADEENLIDYVRAVARSAVAEVALEFDSRDMYMSRHSFQEALQGAVALAFEAAETHCELQTLELTNVDLPSSADRALLATTTAIQDVQNAAYERAREVLEAEIRVQVAQANVTVLLLEAERERDEITLRSDEEVLIERQRVSRYSYAFGNITSGLGVSGEFFVNYYLPAVILKEEVQGQIYADLDTSMTQP